MSAVSPVLSWGLIATGGIADVFARALPASRTGKLTAVGSREQASADAFAAKHGAVRAHGNYQAVLDDPDFAAGDLSTRFIEERPWLVRGHQSKDRGTKVLNWLADVTVNQPNGSGVGLINPALKLPDIDLTIPAPDGSRQKLLSLGPVGFASALRAQTPLAVTETTMRDAHQSLLATRVRTLDLVAVLFDRLSRNP